jgi:hypothetical protein
MGNLLGGGGGGGLLGGGGSGGGGGFLGNLLGGLPDPLGLGKMLGITGDKGAAPGGAPQGPMGPPQPSGTQFARIPGQPTSGVSFDPSSLGNSPMGPTGFGVGGGGQGQR